MMATWRWAEFEVRLGIRSLSHPRAQPMPFEHFLQMERRLLETLGLHPAVIDLALRFVGSQRATVEISRHGKAPAISRDPSGNLAWTTLKHQVSQLFGDKFRRDVSRERISALLVIMANTSVLFTTRDWDVAGTLSAMAGATPLLLPRSSK
jgi:hypothetical protein